MMKRYRWLNKLVSNCRYSDLSIQLLKAIPTQSVNYVKWLLEHGADVNVENLFGETPIHLAAALDDYNILRTLLKFDTNVNVKTVKNETALGIVLQKAFDNPRGDIYCFDVIKNLIDKGADVMTQDSNGRTAFHLAVRECEEGMINYLISQDVDVNVADNCGRTAFYSILGSPNHDYVPVVKLLLDNNADVNTVDQLGISLFTRILQLEASIEIVKLIIAHGADIFFRNYEGRSTLHAAVESYWDDVRVVELLLAEGLDINDKDAFDQTPLHIAVCDADSVMVEFLLKRGANINEVDINGNTPLLRLIDDICLNYDLHNFNEYDQLETQETMLKYILEYHDLVHIVNSDEGKKITSRYLPDTTWRIILENLVSSSVKLNVPIDRDLPIEKNLKEYYCRCKEELSMAQDTLLYGKIRVIDILHGTVKNLNIYGLCKQFLSTIEVFKNKCPEKFPIYGESIVTNLEDEMSIQISSDHYTNELKYYNRMMMHRPKN